MSSSDSRLCRLGASDQGSAALLQPGDLRFVAVNLQTVPHLEALLLLQEAGERAVSPLEIAQRLYVPTHSAGEVLIDLARRGLASETGQSLYRYAPNADDAACIERIVSAYRRQTVRLSNFILEEAAALRASEYERGHDAPEGDSGGPWDAASRQPVAT